MRTDEPNTPLDITRWLEIAWEHIHSMHCNFQPMIATILEYTT